MEEWNDADWTGIVRVYRASDVDSDDYDDYDERRKKHGRAYDD